MSKSDFDTRSRLDISDSSKIILERCQKALSDMQSNITYDPENRPAISSLINLYSALTKQSQQDIINECSELDTKGFKEKLAKAIDHHFAPIREKYEALMSHDSDHLCEILEYGRQRAQKVALQNMAELKDLLGLRL